MCTPHEFTSNVWDSLNEIYDRGLNYWGVAVLHWNTNGFFMRSDPLDFVGVFDSANKAFNKQPFSQE